MVFDTVLDTYKNEVITMDELKSEIRDWIKKKAAAERMQLKRKHITGEELAKVGPIISEINDPDMARIVRGFFTLSGKYGALENIINKDGGVWQKHPVIAARIAVAATETERAVVESYKR